MSAMEIIYGRGLSMPIGRRSRGQRVPKDLGSAGFLVVDPDGVVRGEYAFTVDARGEGAMAASRAIGPGTIVVCRATGRTLAQVSRRIGRKE